MKSRQKNDKTESSPRTQTSLPINIPHSAPIKIPVPNEREETRQTPCSSFYIGSPEGEAKFRLFVQRQREFEAGHQHQQSESISPRY
ncbi:hypothetical protein AQUSIP_01420 [Aquicella siphonis]|uniref:Uncharacterized protein n=1 Tax=Aquicella siphonis TaxID=254247 RepID=A0A5E4PEG4_9COXI|nr:hypothetical protein [Aquicella siphonis]VVC74868.1 hypothetical protein AQUSIP_01420 [Aquicella siphonis]